MKPRTKHNKFEELCQLEEKMEAEGIKRKEEVISEKEKEKLRRKAMTAYVICKSFSKVFNLFLF